MKTEILRFFSIQRRIFGICPRSGEFFRLSDCQIFLKKTPPRDWMDGINSESLRLEMIQEKIDEKESELRDKAREKGRQLAKMAIKKVDVIFSPRRLNPDDAKVVFHPLDYVVFNGMKDSSSMKNIIFLDREAKTQDHRVIQRSIERVVEKGNYEWQTLQIHEDGTIKSK